MDNFDQSRYKWRRDEKVPGLFKRDVGGGERMEDIWNFYNKGEQNLFLGLYTKISQVIDADSLLAHAQNAWVSTRWDIPTIASQALHESREGSLLPASLLAYTLPSDVSEVETWAKETVFVKQGFKDLDELRYEVGHGLLPTKDLEYQTFIYILPFSSTEIGFLIRTSHVPFDGSGLKTLGSVFLEHLSKYIADPGYASAEVTRHKWGTEWEHLLPIASEALRTHEPAEYDEGGNLTKAEVPEEIVKGPQYAETLTEVLTNLGKGGSIAHPFKTFKTPAFDPKTADPSNRRAFYTFSPEDSKKVIAVGSKTGANRLTVNHLAHGALSLVLVLDNPPTPGSPNVVFYYGIVNSRQRLASAYRGTFDYPGYCLGMSAIQIPVSLVDKYPDGIEANLKDVVIEFAQTVKKEYKRQTDYPSLLAIENEQVELMLTGPPLPPWRGPSFSGDGRGGIYLRPTYPKDGTNVIEVPDFFVGLNRTDPGPFFRITEWNGIVKLSADYNEHAVESSVVEGWMKKWAELMLTVVA